MQKELLKEAIITVAGKQAEDVVNYIDGKKYINEFLIAKKLDITINQLRNILYKLSDEGIVSSVRKKDKRKGWYTYFWKIEILRALNFLKEILEKRTDQEIYQIESRKKKNFYICERCGIEITEENALLQEFTCGECGDVFTMKDNTKLLRELAKNLDKQRKKLQIIQEEINKEKERLEKKKIRDDKKEKKAAKLKRELTRKKTSKKTTKKKVKKTEKNKKPKPKKKTKIIKKIKIKKIKKSAKTKKKK